MRRTLTVPGNAEDPAVGRRQGPVRTWRKERPEGRPEAGGRCPKSAYAAELLPAEVPLLDDLESEEDEDDELVLDDFVSEPDVDGFEDDDAGELLDEEPRLSLR
jgi:hypothetical protein